MFKKSFIPVILAEDLPIIGTHGAGSADNALDNDNVYHEFVDSRFEVRHLLPSILRIEHHLGIFSGIDAHSNDPFSVLQVGSLQQKLLLTQRKVLVVNDDLA